MTARVDSERCRRSIRLKGYDYAQAGAYFVTICAHDRACLFGEVVDGAVQLNEAGTMVQAVWDEMSAHYPGVDTDAFVIMPNHVHGIIVLTDDDRARLETLQSPVGAAPCGRPSPRGRPNDRDHPKMGQPRGVAPTMALPDVVHRFKTLTTKRYTDGVKQRGWPPYSGWLWQRNYYEHVIRNGASLNRIRQYIADNPARWAEDPENPVGAGPRACPEGPRACPDNPGAEPGRPPDSGQPRGVAPTFGHNGKGDSA